MKTFDVLDPNTAAVGRHFLEASAGTGKTFTIENVIPRLILESTDPIQIDQILVVTFTRAATRELKTRIHAHLREIAGALQAGRGGPSYIQKYFISKGEALQIARRKIEEACFCFERAQIFTLHGFALKMLQRFAFDAKSFVGKEEDTKNRELIAYIKDFLRLGIGKELFSPSQMQKIYNQRSVNKDSEALCDQILSLLEKGEEIHSYGSAIESYNAWQKALFSFSLMQEEDLWKNYKIRSPRLVNSVKWKEQVQKLFSYIAKGECSFEEWDQFIAEKELFLSQIKPAKGKEEITVHSDLFENMRSTFLHLHEAATNVDILMLQLAKAAEAYYKKGKREKSVYSPDDFIIHLREALQEACFIQKVQGSYKALIIDEFQDTDAAQWEIFSKLFFSEEKGCPNIYLVGDPKQSIYSFRSADVYIYLQAKNQFAKEEQYHLNTNYRSHPKLVEALGVLFSVNLPHNWMFLPKAAEGLIVQPVFARSDYNSSFADEKKGRIHFFGCDQQLGKKTKWPTIETEEEKIIPYIAQEIARLKKEVGIHYKQIAILVKDRFQAGRVQKLLSEYKIPCQMQKGITAKSPSFLSMEELIACLVSPKEISCLKKFLGGALVGYTEEDLQGGIENPLVQKTREYFQLAKRKVEQKGFGVFFVDFLADRSFIKDKSIAEALLLRDKEELYFEIRQICQILIQYSPKGYYDIPSLQEFFKDLKGREYKELLHRYAEQEEDEVHVMTVHKSKGLEFEIVFALSLPCRHTGQEAYVLTSKEEGKELIARLEERSFSLYEQEIDAEKLRQLYVALTRAKERVYIPIIAPLEPQEVGYGTASALEVFLGSRGLDHFSFTEVYENISGFTKQNLIEALSPLFDIASITYEDINLIPKERCLQEKEELSLEPPSLFSSSFSQGYICSFSSLIKEKKEINDLFFSKENVPQKEKPGLPLGAETGVIIHAILESLCKADLHHYLSKESEQLVINHCKGTLLEGQESLVVDMIFGALHTSINSDIGEIVLANIPHSDLRAEVEFLYPIGSSFMKGFIDLIFQFQGKYFLLDWKTNALGEDSEKGAKECMQDHRYDIQAAIYSCALKKYISMFDSRPFAECFGGAIYFFLREKKAFLFNPDLSLTTALEQTEDLLWTK